MPDRAFPVRWAGQQAIVTLPRHIDHMNADQIREQLLWIINRGATVLIADLTGTISCDFSGADALARAQHRAIANGTELRLVVTANVVRRVLSLNGFERLIAIYPDLDAALAAGAESRDPADAPPILAAAGDHAAPEEELLDLMVDSIFNVGLILQAAVDAPCEVTARRVTDALGHLDDMVREIRDHMFVEHQQRIGSDRAVPWSGQLRARAGHAADRSRMLQGHVARTARAVQSATADTATLLERRADQLGYPRRIDYSTEIKRWRVLADQARQIAERWEQS